MHRQEAVFKHINPGGHGLEIGPSHNPIAPKKGGYNVHIIDHLDQAGLRAKYRDHGVDLTNIEEVDFIWNGQPYAELIGKTKCYDWIIASHVIEHTPDLIDFINNCSAMLKDDGALSLVIPDKRYCFDRFRPITGLARIIDSHLNKNKIHTAGAAAEYFLNVVSRNQAIAWNCETRGNYAFVHGLADANTGIECITKHNGYLDVHAWCFVPDSFRLLIEDLCSLKFIDLREVGYVATHGCEFYVTLSRTGKGPDKSRMDLLHSIDRSQSGIE